MQDLANNLSEQTNQNLLNRKAGKHSLYMIDYYNIKDYEKALSTGVPTIMRVLNALVEATNEGKRLPKYIFIILDSDIVSDLQFVDKTDAYKEVATYVNWLARQVDIHIRRMKLQHLEINPGAGIEDYPQIIYVLMVKRVQFYPEDSKLAKLCTLHSKFNECINKATAKREAKVLSIRSLTTDDCFDKRAALSIKGKHLFWDELDKLLERFERGELKLIPKATRDNRQSKNARATKDDYRANGNNHRVPHEDSYFTQSYRKKNSGFHHPRNYYDI